MRVPWIVIGVVIGALFMRTWPGQDKWGLLWEMTLWCGGGLVAGLLVEVVLSWLRQRDF
jgi:uncharacterized membrane protein YeaQ/YmgE (transglycosylase-associated protein family)